MNQTVDAAELYKETRFWMIISTFPCVILWLLFALFGISYHRNLFYRKTENAHGCLTCRSVSRIPFLKTKLLKPRNKAKKLRVICSESCSTNSEIIFCYRRGRNRHSSHSRSDLNISQENTNSFRQNWTGE